MFTLPPGLSAQSSSYPVPELPLSYLLKNALTTTNDAAGALRCIAWSSACASRVNESEMFEHC